MQCFKTVSLLSFAAIRLTYIVASLFKATTRISKILISPLLKRVSSNACTAIFLATPTTLCFADKHLVLEWFLSSRKSLYKSYRPFKNSPNFSHTTTKKHWWVVSRFFFKKDSIYTELISVLEWRGFPIRELILKSGMWKYWRSNSSSSQPIWRRGKSCPILVKTKAGWENPVGANPADTARGNKAHVEGLWGDRLLRDLSGTKKWEMFGEVWGGHLHRTRS